MYVCVKLHACVCVCLFVTECVLIRGKSLLFEQRVNLVDLTRACLLGAAASAVAIAAVAAAAASIYAQVIARRN